MQPECFTRSGLKRMELNMSAYLVVGGVAGGMSAAARLRRLKEKDSIIVFEKGGYVSYANCGLPYYIGGGIPKRDDLFVETPESLYSRFKIDVRLYSEVISIDTNKKTVSVKKLQTGEVYEEKYDKLILSPGSNPVKPQIPGINDPRIFFFWNVEDTDKLHKFINENRPKKAAVIGSGFVGLEITENLKSLGIDVTLIEALDTVMPAMDPEISGIIKQQLVSENVKILTGHKVVSFYNYPGKLCVKTDKGCQENFDLVVVSIGVVPNTGIAEKAGLKLGVKKAITVNEYMQTSDPDIYAVGDAVEIVNLISGEKANIPLAGPANKQGRLAADNIANANIYKYPGTIGTSVLKIFGLTVASAGLNEHSLKTLKIPFKSVTIHPLNHAGYYPGAEMLTLKVHYSPETGRLLGAQCAGKSGVDKRIDVISAFMQKNGTINDLKEFENAYAPPYSSAKDPVNMAGFTAENDMAGNDKIMQWDEYNPQEYFLLDVRTLGETELEPIKGAVTIPVDELRGRLPEIPKDRKIAVTCRVGIRAHTAVRILTSNGFKEVFNLSGGYLSYKNLL